MNALRVAVIVAVFAFSAGCGATIHPPIPPVQLAQPDSVISIPGVYPRSKVDTQVRLVGGAMPAYPEKLRAQGVQGEVRVEFAVDTTGQVMPESIKVLASSHEIFTAAVLKALPNMMFSPAVLAGRKVRELAIMPFAFNLNHR